MARRSTTDGANLLKQVLSRNHKSSNSDDENDAFMKGASLLKNVLARNHESSDWDDEYDSFIKDLNEIMKFEPPSSSASQEQVQRDDCMIWSSEHFEIHQRLIDLIRRAPNRKPVPTSDEIRLSHADLRCLIEDWTPFIDYSMEFAHMRLKKVRGGKLENIDKAQIACKKWKALRKAWLQEKSTEELRELLISVFNDLEWSLELTDGLL